MKKFTNLIKKRYQDNSNILHDIILLTLSIFCFIYPWILIILIIIILIITLISIINNNNFIKQAKGNGIIYGGRGKGKGLLLNYIIRKDNSKPYCNVKYGDAELLTNIADYLNSIDPLTINDFINGTIKHIPKKQYFEGRNIYLDDINVYLPNWSDSELKKKYPSLPLLLAINRHLYNAHCIITTQDRERPYKILKELQSDFSIKAIDTKGFGFIWNSIPILRYYVTTKYIYHELPKSADMLPFKALGVINEGAKHGYLTSGQATKEVYEATNGVIKYGRCIQLKKHIRYDTRYFHNIVFGTDAQPKE